MSSSPVLRDGDFVVVQQLAGRFVQGFRQYLGLIIADFDADVLQRYAEGEEFSHRIPAQVVFLHELVDVLGRGAAGAGFEQAAARHQRYDGKHFRARAELHDREQVGQIITQDIAGHRNRVFAADNAPQGITHTPQVRHNLNVEPRQVVILEVAFDFLDQLGLVGAILLQPKHRGVLDCRARVTANFTQSRIAASLVWHIRQISPTSTFCSISTLP